MKKLLFLLLSAAVTVSVTGGITRTSNHQKNTSHKATTTKLAKTTRATGAVTPMVPGQFHGWDNQVSHASRSGQAITWDFEDENQFNDFNCIDNDGDGFNWYYITNAGHEWEEWFYYETHSGDGIVCSKSYYQEDHRDLTPDNWLISPRMILGSTLSFFAIGQSDDVFSEKFGVYVCVGTPTGVEDFVQLGDDFTTTDEFQEFVVDLSAYEGQVGHFAIVHHNVSGQFILNIDDITTDGNSVKVIDFGVSDTASYAILKGPAGTRAYAAPELMAGENVDSRADIFSLGVIIGQMNSHLPRQDRRLAKVAKRCSAVDPAQRPASSSEVLKALQRPPSRLYYYLAAIVVAAAIAAIVWTMLPDRSSRRDVAATPSAPTVDTVATSTTAPVQQAEKQDSTAQDQPIQSVQPIQQDETPAVTSPNRQVPQEQPAPEPELSPNMRQLYLAKTAQVGYNEARKSRARLLEIYSTQGKELFDQHITESLRERIELEVINVANDMFPATDPRFKPLREYMASPAGRQLIDAGRQEALERAQIILHEAFPDLTIPPFPAATPNWQDRKQ